MLASAHTLKLAHQIVPMKESKSRPVVLGAGEPRWNSLCDSFTLLEARGVDLIFGTICGIVAGSSNSWIERCETRICWENKTYLRAFSRVGFEAFVPWRVAPGGPVRECPGRHRMRDC